MFVLVSIFCFSLLSFIDVCMLGFYRSLLILCFVFYLYFVFFTAAYTWRIKPDDINYSIDYATNKHRTVSGIIFNDIK